MTQESESTLEQTSLPSAEPWSGADRRPRPPISALVVDDDEMVRDVLRRALERKGVSVRTTSTGREAIETYQRAPADLVVLDLLLPDIDGLDVLLELGWTNPRFTAIAISGGMGDADFLAVAEKLGAVRALGKPFAVDEFLATVDRVMSLRQASSRPVDRRRRPRFSARVPVEFTAVRTRGRGLVTNLSLGGCTVESETLPDLDERVSLHLGLPAHRLGVTLDFTTVRWVDEGRFGIEFLGMSSREQQGLKDILRRIVL